MSVTAVRALLQAALTLLTLVQPHPELEPGVRDAAFEISQQAIAEAATVLAVPGTNPIPISQPETARARPAAFSATARDPQEGQTARVEVPVALATSTGLASMLNLPDLRSPERPLLLKAQKLPTASCTYNGNNYGDGTILTLPGNCGN